MKEELLEEELDEENEKEEEEIKVETKGKVEKIELDFLMDPIERLQKEIDFTNSDYQKIVGEFLISKFKDDEVLKNCYKERKVTLKTIWDSIVAAAKKKAVSGAAVMSDDEVFGLAIHFVQDGEIKANKEEELTLTKAQKKSLEQQAKEEYLAEQKRKLAEEEQKRLEKEKAARAKEKKALEDSGQLVLFDLFGDEDENGN